jgi:hypothetical protein
MDSRRTRGGHHVEVGAQRYGQEAHPDCCQGWKEGEEGRASQVREKKSFVGMEKGERKTFVTLTRSRRGRTRCKHDSSSCGKGVGRQGRGQGTGGENGQGADSSM